MEQRAAIKFCFKLKKTPSETLELLQTAYGNECLSRSKVFEADQNSRGEIENQDHVDGKGNMETYWLESTANNETKEEISNDKNVEIKSLLVTSI
ncbi:GVQW3 protein, partial [Acromyrmex heyeri]